MEGYQYANASTGEIDEVNGARMKQKPVIDPKSADIGIAQRSFNQLVQKVNGVKETEGKHISIFCSFLQIYNERVFDLLNMGTKKGSLMNQKGLRVRYDKKE